MQPKWTIGKPCEVKASHDAAWLPAVVVEMRGGKYGTPIARVSDSEPVFGGLLLRRGAPGPVMFREGK